MGFVVNPTQLINEKSPLEEIYKCKRVRFNWGHHWIGLFVSVLFEHEALKGLNPCSIWTSFSGGDLTLPMHFLLFWHMDLREQQSILGRI